MTDTQAELFDQLSRAVARAQERLECDDSRDCFDWLATAQIRLGELMATLVLRVQNNQR